ncbi:MAG: ATP-binding cassette domain-containing protein [Polyangiaceae bacterium]
MRFDFPEAPRSGEDVVKFDSVGKAYGKRVIYQGFDWLVRRKERWCVMGINGAGKSTLLKLATGTIHPDSGRVNVGASVQLGYFAQHSMELLNENSTVWETLTTQFPWASIGSLRTLAGVSGFSGDAIEKGCRFLSGGEKARLVLALMLYEPPELPGRSTSRPTTSIST